MTPMHYLGPEHRQVHDLGLKVFINLGCESWLHEKSKASSVDYYIAFLKAG